ncbi:MAG: GSCFA domain-containing protein [Paludibacter sp.]|nr:GSCFA domain-containing protein [Paludibacter sp.]
MFQTKVEIPRPLFNISYENRIMTLGSCFAENIGKKMQDVYFDMDINPFGVLYNPVSILNSLDILINNKQFTKNDLFENRGLWQSFSHSSLFSDTDVDACLAKINNRLINASDFLRQADFLLITFGTAWVYEEQKSGRVVSNCHKLPASDFNRRRLTIDEIVADYSILINRLSELIPDLKVIFSVSPIRHWKDGAHENNVSKGTLLLAIDELQKRFSHISYFPAYEIQVDELRDYRFYASDMLHPSEVAIDYIWKRFSETYFNEKTSGMKRQFEQLAADLSHRPLHPDSEEFKQFLENTKNRKAKLISDFPFLLNRIKF